MDILPRFFYFYRRLLEKWHDSTHLCLCCFFNEYIKCYYLSLCISSFMISIMYQLGQFYPMLSICCQVFDFPQQKFIPTSLHKPMWQLPCVNSGIQPSSICVLPSQVLKCIAFSATWRGKNGECPPVSQILGLKVTCIICTDITFLGTSHRPSLVIQEAGK